jgi:hypothetical protein
MRRVMEEREAKCSSILCVRWGVLRLRQTVSGNTAEMIPSSGAAMAIGDAADAADDWDCADAIGDAADAIGDAADAADDWDCADAADDCDCVIDASEACRRTMDMMGRSSSSSLDDPAPLTVEV